MFVARRSSVLQCMLNQERNFRFSKKFYSKPAEQIETSEIETRRSRLLYQSKKRGILENDIIIGGFAAKHLNDLSSSELDSYDKIINNNDHMEWDLYYYFVGRKDAPPELKNCPVFKRICVFACSKKAAIDKQ